MTAPPVNRRLDEILALYKLEPSLKDIYVEGEDDAKIMRWFLQRNGQCGISVHEIHIVEIPVPLFHECDLNASCTRDHVVLFSEKLHQVLPGAGRRVRCVADAEVPPDYVPDVMRELTTSLDVYSGGGGIAEAGGIHVAANAAGVRYPKALCGRR